MNNNEMVEFLKIQAVMADLLDHPDAIKYRQCAAALRNSQGEREALELILPLAKGYAADHPVGSNYSYIEIAERALLTNKPKAKFDQTNKETRAARVRRRTHMYIQEPDDDQPTTPVGETPISDTPRTDNKFHIVRWDGTLDEFADFARQLERELNAALQSRGKEK